MALDIQTLRTQSTYQATALANTLSSEIQTLSAIDQQVEKALKRANTLLIVGIVLTFISIFLMAIAVGFITLPIGLGLAIWGGISGHRLRKINIPNYRYELLGQVLAMLNRDLKPDQPLTLQLGLTPVEQPTKKQETLPHRYRQGWKIDRYEDPWLSLAGELDDGTEFTLTATEHHQSHYGWKRGRSGKMKYKRKAKPKGQEIILALSVSRRKYGAITVLQNDLGGAIKLPAFAQLKGISLRDNKLTLRLKTLPSAASKELYQATSLMFLSLYHVLNLSRQLSKKA